MSLHTALYSYLTAQSGFTDVFSTRLYPNQAPASATTLPYCVYEIVSGEHIHHLEAAAGLVQRRVIFTVVAATPISCEAGYDALRGELDGYPNTTMGTNNLAVGTVSLDGEDFTHIPQKLGTDVAQGTFVVEMTFMIWHAESVPTF
jgi:hypothetical protein